MFDISDWHDSLPGYGPAQVARHGPIEGLAAKEWLRRQLFDVKFSVFVESEQLDHPHLRRKSRRRVEIQNNPECRERYAQ